jgi:hypothetical protein
MAATLSYRLGHPLAPPLQQTLKELHQEEGWRWEARQAGQLFDETLVKPGGELARHRVWQASHFQRLVLGPDAEKVRGPAMLLTQTAELRAWRATEGIDVLGPCLQQVQEWAGRLQQQLRTGGVGDSTAQQEDKEAASQRAAAKAAKRAARNIAAAASMQQKEREQQQQAADLLQPPPAASKLQQRQQRVRELRLQLQQQPLLEQGACAALVRKDSRAGSPAPAALLHRELSQVSQQTDGADLSEVEQQLQALQAQVNAALAAAEERLRTVALSPAARGTKPAALPRLALSHAQGDGGGDEGGDGAMLLPCSPEAVAAVAALQRQQQAQVLLSEAELLAAAVREGHAGAEAEEAVAEAAAAVAVAAYVVTPRGPAQPSSSGGSEDLGAAAEAIARNSRLVNSDDAEAATELTEAFLPWAAAGGAAAEQLPAGCVPPAQAKLAYQRLMHQQQEPLRSSKAGADGGNQSSDGGGSFFDAQSVLQSQGSSVSGQGSECARPAGLVSELSEAPTSGRTVASDPGSRPASFIGTVQQQQQHGCSDDEEGSQAQQRGAAGSAKQRKRRAPAGAACMRGRLLRAAFLLLTVPCQFADLSTTSCPAACCLQCM